MNIFFDIFILMEGIEETLTVDERAVFDEIHTYFSQKLFPLKEQMDADEAKEASCVMIHFLPEEGKKDNVRISINRYNKELGLKIQESLTPDVLELLNDRLQNTISRFWN